MIYNLGDKVLIKKRKFFKTIYQPGIILEKIRRPINFHDMELFYGVLYTYPTFNFCYKQEKDIISKKEYRKLKLKKLSNNFLTRLFL